MMMRLILILIALCSFSNIYAQQILNVYAWTGEIPERTIKQFEQETGIKVNFSTYENNEILYAKLRASKKSNYDVIMPSSYFVDRMRKQNMLAKLDKTQLSNWKNLNPALLHPSYDPNTEYSVPFIWGTTGIFINTNFHTPIEIKTWSDLWNTDFRDQLLLLDDSREVFSMALLSLGYSPNDNDPEHIKAAFLKLKNLMQNVKVFSTATVISILIDEDATLGMAWNGDTYKAMQENNKIQFIYPQDGFVIWVDNFAIPKNAQHKKAAYQFINFMLQAEIAKQVALATNFAITNLAGQKLLPANIQNNMTIYPSKEILKRGQFQTDLDEKSLAVMEKYWEELKMG